MFIANLLAQELALRQSLRLSDKKIRETFLILGTSLAKRKFAESEKDPEPLQPLLSLIL